MNFTTYLARQNNWKEAIFFCISFYVLLLGSVFIVGALFAGLVMFSNGVSEITDQQSEQAFLLGYLISIVANVTVGILMLRIKKLTGDFLSVGLVVLTGVMTVALGGLIGFIPIALLSMRAPEVSDSSRDPEPQTEDEGSHL